MQPHRIQPDASLSKSPRPARRAMTLIELLVVIAIVLSISAVALPILAPRGEGRRQREAARILTTFLNAARTRAIELGRPAGVWIEGLSNDPETIVALSTCEVPPDYTGETFNSRLLLNVVPGTPPTIQVVAMVHLANDGSQVPLAAPIRAVRMGDIVTFNYQSAEYRIINFVGGSLDQGYLPPLDPSASPPPVWIIEPVDPTSPPPPSGVLLPFSIQRAPVKSAAPPLELPRGAILKVDFSGDEFFPLHPLDDYSDASFFVSTGTASGHDPHNWVETRLANFNEPVIVLFSPGGGVDSVYRFIPNGTVATATAVNWSRQPQLGPFYLLLGEIENAEIEGAPPEQAYLDLFDADNQWVMIHPSTGTATSAEVGLLTDAQQAAFESLAKTDNVTEGNMKTLLNISRQNLTQGRGRGGR